MNRTSDFGFDLHPELRTVTPSAATDRNASLRPSSPPDTEPQLRWRLPASVRRHRPDRRS